MGSRVGRRTVHILYEHGADLQPYSTAYLRLLRPFGHPAVQERVAPVAALDYHGEPTDIVIVDRLWRPDLTVERAEALLERVRHAGARLIHALDDDLLGLPADRPGGPTAEQRAGLAALIGAADGLLVTTAPLAERLAPLNPRIAIVPNALDERLMPAGWAHRLVSPFDPRPVVGYMGTFTHDEDLRLVATALRAAHRQLPHGLIFEIVSGLRDRSVLAAFDGIPVRLIRLPPADIRYLPFNLWFTHAGRWDLGIAPLVDTPFNRCKSDLKFLDYAAAGVAGIFSRVTPYAATIRHGENGWLVDNDAEAWQAALVTLLGDDARRTALADAAASELRATRTLAQRAGDWVAALDQLGT
jgi:processive 1,2-diacylglycerol beta-glucosyltransferase